MDEFNEAGKMVFRMHRVDKAIVIGLLVVGVPICIWALYALV